MKWTKTNPKKVGYYWFKDSTTSGEIVRVSEIADNKLYAQGAELCFKFTKGGKSTGLDRWSNVPIQKPN